MLSYRHGFHAGNHADVIKHITICLILESLLKKDKPCVYIDTHSGAGAYSLKSQWSAKTGEYKNGIAKIYNNDFLRKLIPSYFKVISDINDNTLNLDNYPGSPFFAANLLRDSDDISLVELHPNEYQNLKYNMHYYNNVHVHHREANEALKALLPPKHRRGLVLIDPSYEMKEDYINTIKLVKEGITKFPQGIFAIWYPVLGKAIDESYNFIRNLTKLNIQSTLQIELNIAQKDDERGMNGSGMIILNAPYKLDEKIKEIIPTLTKELALNNTANYKLGFLVEP